MANTHYERLTEKEKTEETPSRHYGLCSLLFFSWLSPLVKLGNEQPLEEEDLVSFPGQRSAKDLTERIENLWSAEIKLSRSPRLWLVVLRFLPKQDAIFLALTHLMFTCGRYFKPVFLFMLLTELGINRGSNMSYVYAVGMAFSVILETFLKNHYKIRGILIATHIRIALTGLVYKKILEKTENEIAESTSGHVINIVSKDMEPLTRATCSCTHVLLAPLEIIATSCLLWYFVGLGSLTSMIVVLVSLLIQVIIGKSFKILRREIAAFTDHRLRGITDIITGIRVVKMNAWETCLEKRIGETRRKEISSTRKKTAIYGTVLSFGTIFSAFTTFVALVSMVLTGHQLTTRQVFTTYLLMDIIQSGILENFVEAMLFCSQSLVSFRRIQHFLVNETNDSECKESLEELKLEEKVPATFKPQNMPSDVMFEKKRTFDDLPGQIQTPLLLFKNISCYNNSNKLLEDISFTTYGNQLLSVTGPVGSGKTSIFNAIIGELSCTKGEIRSVLSILVGEEFDEKRYSQVIKACGLEQDFELLTNGDLTLIGERGILLSGGQRSRVTLARAVYSNSQIYLLDDPLSALDANVSAHVFDKCLCGILNNRLRILVTHAVEHLAKSDRIVVMKDGRAVQEGTYTELLTTDGYITYLNSLAQERNRNLNERKRMEGTKAHKQLSSQRDIHSNDYVGLDTAQEDRDVGNVTCKTYWMFLRAGAPILLLLLAISLFLIAEGFIVASNVWLSQWSKMTFHLQRSSTNLAIYGSILAAASLFAFLRTLLFSLIALRSSEVVHNKMLKAVLKAPVIFFDTNPMGRILNRFSKDTGCMDDVLPIDMYYSLQMLLSNVVALLLMSGTVFYISIAAVPVLLLIIYISRYTDKSANALLCFLGCNRWISLRIELAASLFAAGMMFTAIIMRLDDALTGLAVTYALNLCSTLYVTTFLSMSTEYWMTSVQRVMKYTELEPEPGYELTKELPAEWPKNGMLQLKDTSLRYYNQAPTVLNKLCLTVRSGEKVGIGGRTGAGKSSLIAALMRMPEHEGDIVIDGVTIKELNLAQSRSVVSVITQNPFLFTDTLRFNLDPEEKHTDSKLWHVLEKMQLKSLIQKAPGQLYCLVHENGSNFSVGERQMICLARAMLQKNRIIVFDEATASIDLKTEKLIHEAVHTMFDDCTVLTIAHRLDTITDHDRVLVLDEGKVVEFDEPKVLLTIGNGYFTKLYKSYTAEGLQDV